MSDTVGSKVARTLLEDPSDEQMAKLYNEGVGHALMVLGPIVCKAIDEGVALTGLPPRIEALAWTQALSFLGVMIARTRGTPIEALADVFDMCKDELQNPDSPIVNPRSDAIP